MRRRRAQTLLVGAADLERQPDVGQPVHAEPGRDRAGVAEDVGDLVGRQPEVHRHGDRAEVMAREQDSTNSNLVVEQQRDAVAAADAGRGEHAGKALRPLVERPVRQRPVPEHQRGPVGMRPATAADRLSEHEPSGPFETRHRAYATRAICWTSGGRPIIARIRPMKKSATRCSAMMPLGRYHCQMLL